MTVRYANPDGSNTSPYDTVAKGATDPQTIFDLAEAGDECRLVGTFTHGTEFTGPLTIDTNAGTSAGGFIKVIGVNDSGTNDGTRAVLSGNNKAGAVMQLAGKDLWLFENIRFTQSSGEGVDDGSSTVEHNTFINCVFDNNTSNGCGTFQVRSSRFFKCAFYDNGGAGTSNGGVHNAYLFCSFHDNSSDGIKVQYNTTGIIIGCLVYDNGGYGINDAAGVILMSNTVNGNSNDGIEVRGTTYLLNLAVANRITNHPAGKYGIDWRSACAVHGYNYFEDNAAGNMNDSTLTHEILDSGAGTNDEDNADTNEGYTSKTDGSEDFNLRSDATLRRTAISIPVSA